MSGHALSVNVPRRLRETTNADHALDRARTYLDAADTQLAALAETIEALGIPLDAPRP